MADPPARREPAGGARVGHVHLKVSDLGRSERFYRDALGLEVTERLAGFLFMSFGREHHDVALQEHPGAPPADPRALGLFHFAVEVDGEADLEAAIARLDGAGVRWSGVDYGISKAVYLSDPDGHGIEIYCDTRQATGVEEWQGTTRPLDRAGGAGK